MPVFTERYEGVQDRTDWPSGPWDGEPDKVVWKDEQTGLDCMARRGGGGAWCGYVGVTEAHPWHGIDYGDHLPIPCEEREKEDGYCYSHAPDALIEVHGGLTYSSLCREDAPPESGVCHLSDDGPVFWFGFDCSHYLDRRPGSEALNRRHGWAPDPDEVYRDLDYVVAEVTRLAEQLAAVQS